MDHLHRSEPEDDGNANFGLHVHLDVPDQEDGKDAKGPVRGGADGRVRVCSGGDAMRVDALASRDGHVPEEGDRITLEQKEEEIEDAEYNAGADNDPDDLYVSSMNGDA